MHSEKPDSGKLEKTVLWRSLEVRQQGWETTGMGDSPELQVSKGLRTKAGYEFQLKAGYEFQLVDKVYTQDIILPPTSQRTR